MTVVEEGAPMRMRRDICLGGLADLIPGSAAHGLPLPDQLALLRGYGYRGIVAWDHWDAIRGAGLIPCGMARVREARDALPVARLHRDAGLDFTTLHVGTGFETDREMALLAEAVIEAAAITGHPLHVEIHRATMTQDIRRTVDLIERFQALRFTLDFSHWYTGHEMTYTDEVAERLAWLDPVFRRVDSLQARIGTTGAIQRPVDLRSAG
jgi:sugar phosphate isomerase/epimerase